MYISKFYFIYFTADNIMLKKIKTMRRKHQLRMQQFREQQTRKMRQLKMQFSHQMRAMEEAHLKDIDDLLEEQRKFKKLP